MSSIWVDVSPLPNMWVGTSCLPTRWVVPMPHPDICRIKALAERVIDISPLPSPFPVLFPFPLSQTCFIYEVELLDVLDWWRGWASEPESLWVLQTILWGDEKSCVCDGECAGKMGQIHSLGADLVVVSGDNIWTSLSTPTSQHWSWECLKNWDLISSWPLTENITLWEC